MRKEFLRKIYFKVCPQKVQNFQRSETDFPQLGQVVLRAGAGGVLGAAATTGFTGLAGAGLGPDLEPDFDFDCGGVGIKGTKVDSLDEDDGEVGTNGVNEADEDSTCAVGLAWLVKGAGAGALVKDASSSAWGISTGAGSGTV